jgi:hypothetical protein
VYKAKIVVLALLLSVCVAVTASEALSVSPASLSLEVGQSGTLTASDAKGSVDWNTSSSEISISSSGTSCSVTALSEGVATVVCTDESGTAYARVTVGPGDSDYYEDYEEEGGGCSTFGLGVGILALAGLVLLKKKSKR